MQFFDRSSSCDKRQDRFSRDLIDCLNQLSLKSAENEKVHIYTVINLIKLRARGRFSKNIQQNPSIVNTLRGIGLVFTVQKKNNSQFIYIFSGQYIVFIVRAVHYFLWFTAESVHCIFGCANSFVFEMTKEDSREDRNNQQQ